MSDRDLFSSVYDTTTGITSVSRVTPLNPYPDDNPKTAFGVKKIPLHLIPPVAMEAEAGAFGLGAADGDSVACPINVLPA